VSADRLPSDVDEWPGRWAPAARNALVHAVADARELGCTYVGTEHVLLGLLANDGLAARVLDDLGVTREAVFATGCVNPDPPREPRPHGGLVLMPRLKQALERAGRLAGELGRPAADTEHLLAGILTVPGALAVEILRRAGVSADAIRTELAARLEIDARRLAATRRRRWRPFSRSG
jgi:ATP-dependent Clp protease ATP-binding subunit ClpC